jgi:hypothetical protein
MLLFKITAMKTAFLTSLILISMLAGAQIPKKANTILIAGSATQTEYLKQINTLLFENGYGILSSDPGMGTITTTGKSYKRGTVKFTFLIADRKITMRGQYSTAINSPSEWYDIQYSGMKGSPILEAWNEMSKIADSIFGNKEYLMK